MRKEIKIGSIIAVLLICAFLAFGLWGCPKYKIYQKKLGGEAVLREAEYSRKVLIEEANAKTGNSRGRHK